MITIEEINEAYEDIEFASTEYHDISQNLLVAQRKLQLNYLTAIVTGDINGKNSEMREAQSRTMFSALHNSVDKLTMQHNHRKWRLDIARAEESRLKLIMRLMEVSNDNS